MKKFLGILLIMLIAVSSIQAFAAANPPPAKPNGQAPMGQAPKGQAPAGGAMPGGGQSKQPDSYASVQTVTTDTTLQGDILASTGTDENALLIQSGKLSADQLTIRRNSADSGGGDNSSFYGVGAAVLATGGVANISHSKITTDAAGGAGVFAYGDGTVSVSDTTITTARDTSGGIHVAGGGTLYARNLTVETNGDSSAAIRSDRGGGTMVVEGGTYTANGSGSPAVYCTADIAIQGAALTATGSEALCLEGLNTVRLFQSNLTGAMPDQAQNDNTWTVILYQSMSGDSKVGEGKLEMTGGSLTSHNGGLFYTTNTESEFILSQVEIAAAADSEYFLRCTGNSNQRGWGKAGANGADCTFTGNAQVMTGDVLWDSISTLDLYATAGSTLTGAVKDDESCVGNGGNGYCNLYLDSTSAWVVTGDSVLTALLSEGSITDTEGRKVSVIGTDGTVFIQGDSSFTITVSQYAAQCDLRGAGVPADWSDCSAALAS